MIVRFDPFGSDVHAIEEKRWLFVVEAFDQANGRHQLQIVRTPGLEGATTMQFKMVHSLGDTFGERIVKMSRRLVEILRGVGAELRRLIHRG